MNSNFDFYDGLPRLTSFAAMALGESYTALPDDWVVGTSDIVGSTKAIGAGKYKTVNMIGAAVISAQINASDGHALPYVFGGDGAAFACPPEHAQTAADALTAVQCWAAEEFDMELRVAMTPMTEIRAAGLDVGVARHRVSDGVDYAMFSGGGISWAETQMKAGMNCLAAAPAGTQPDLTGLSCRWSHMKAQSGTILSVVIQKIESAPDAAFSQLCGDVLELVRRLDRGGHPAPVEGPGTGWPPPGAKLEAHVNRGDKSVGKRRRQVLLETFIAWVLIKTRLKIGGFDAKRYQKVVGENADFRKFDDGLKMTIDCDAATVNDLTTLLESARDDGTILFGLHQQDEAMMTCIVPSIMDDNHVHFIDGAAGGYTQAATQIKNG
jgi:hypothetical protein